MCEMETYPSLDYVRVDQGFGGGGGRYLFVCGFWCVALHRGREHISKEL